MRPLHTLAPRDVEDLDGVVFDLDDTLLDHGALTEAAYAALFRLRDCGLRLIGCTGRPLGWVEVLARQWPVDAMIAENGAAAVWRTAGGALHVDLASPRADRSELLTFAQALVSEHPEAALADDNGMRATDVTIDIGEHRRVAPEVVRAMRERAAGWGLATLASSVHLHLTRDLHDKASGTVRVIGIVFGADATRTRLRYAFIGDSGNDAAAFASFHRTFAVANVAPWLRHLTRAPRWVAKGARGVGFAEIANEIQQKRRSDPSAATPG